MRTFRIWLLVVALDVTSAALLHAQQPWSAVESPTSHTLWGIAYGSAPGVPGRFVTVGEGGAILTSPDGLTWAARESGTGQWLLGVTWSPTLKVFVAVGNGGTILTSPDGETWTVRASGTTQRLNSVAWNAKRFSVPDVFIAVGEDGTALLSYDLATWTRRETGDTGWLRGIAAGASDVFVVTGHDGTILNTEDAGETWTRRASGTALHLDAVTYRGNAQFSVTGSNFVLAHTSNSGRSWEIDRGVNADGRENGITYNGLVWFNEALVAVGDQGRIVDEAGRAWTTTEPLFAGWRAVAASPDRVVAVGTNGLIASAPRDPYLGLQYDITPSFLADTIVLSARQRRRVSVPRIRGIQWTLDGTPIADAAGFELRLNTASGAQNGTYAFTITAEDGTSFSSSITLAPQPNPPALGLLDTAFRPALSAAPGAVEPLPDGRLLVAGRESTLVVGGRRVNGPVRLLPDGSLDPTFVVADGTFSGTPIAMLVQPDSRAVVLERIDGATPAHRLVRLNTDGSVDSTFRPDPLLAASGEMPVLLADGRWIAVERQPTTTGNFTAVLRRFQADGIRDAGFPHVELMRGTTDVVTPGRITFFDGPRLTHARDREGRIYLGVQHGDYLYTSVGASGGASRLFRLQANGVPDLGFAAVDLAPLYALAATPQGLLTRTSLKTWTRAGPTVRATTLFRLNYDGTRDAGFRLRTLNTATYTSGPRQRVGLDHDFDVLAALPDGSLLARAVGHLGHFGIVRFDPSGELDRDFNAELGAGAVEVAQIVPLSNGKIIVAGTFPSLLGTTQPFLARLTPNRRAAGTYLANVSVRSRVDAISGPLIAGYVTQGNATAVLARGAGPALETFGVTPVLPDPRLRLFLGSAEIASNDNWESGPAALLAETAARLGAFPFAAGSPDAALYTTAGAGAFTVQLTDARDAPGVGLAEVYHAGPPPSDPSSPRVINFSVRARAGSEADTLIAGFTLHGENTRNVIIRGVGPGLAPFGITDFLPDPVVTVYRGDAAVALSDDWDVDTGSQQTLIEAFSTVGAFQLPVRGGSTLGAGKDAALLMSLAPGSYTVQVTGKAGATGAALVEIYEVP